MITLQHFLLSPPPLPPRVSCYQMLREGSRLLIPPCLDTRTRSSAGLVTDIETADRLHHPDKPIGQSIEESFARAAAGLVVVFAKSALRRKDSFALLEVHGPSRPPETPTRPFAGEGRGIEATELSLTVK